MNEEIGRILQLLETGKINADEAERLIKAVNQPAAAGTRADSTHDTFDESTPSEPCPNPFRDIDQLFRSVARMYRTGLRRHRRFEEWRWHEWRRARADERRRRAESLSIADRVRYVMAERAFLDPDSALQDLDEIARGLLRYELEDEFQIEIPKDDLETVGTLDALITYVEGRAPGAAPAAAPPAPDSGVTARKPRAPRPRTGKSAKDAPAGA